MKFSKLITIAMIFAVAQGCKNKNADEDNSSISETEAVVESGMTAVSGSMDEQSNSSFAFQSVKPNSIWSTLLIDRAQAATCSRAYLQSCSAGVKQIEYSDCSTLNGVRQMAGNVKLSFSNASCTLNSNGDYVTRTYSTAITGPRGGVVSNSSDSATDYRGTSYGGGAKLTKTAAGYNLDILGKHKRMDRNGRQLFNVSVRTLQPLEVTGGLTRAARHVSNGQLEVNHNLAKFSSVITANDIAWGDCSCYPVSGSLSIAFSGSKTGSATVTFTNECGVASLQENGQTSKIELSYCE
tara:strand:+ start:36131 stop:37018 length:888 start_codon:yes stop_codon:yes gene_type:complete